MEGSWNCEGAMVAARTLWFARTRCDQTGVRNERDLFDLTMAGY